MKSINSYNMGERRTIRVCFLFLHSKTLLGFIYSFVLGSPHSSLCLFLGPILWPYLIPCSCLTVYLYPFSGIWEPSLRGKGAMTTLASSCCTGCHGALGPLCLLSVRMHLQREMRVHGMIRLLVLASSGFWSGNILVVLPLGDLLYSRRNKFNKKVKDTWPKD